MSTDMTRVRDALGRKPKTVAELAAITSLTEGRTRDALRGLVAQSKARQAPQDGGGYGYVRFGRYEVAAKGSRDG